MDRHKIHYAWFVLLGCTLMYFTTTGLACNNFSIYSPFIMRTYDYSQTKVSLITSSSSLAATVMVLFSTKYYRRFSVKNGLLLNGLLMCSAYVIFGLADNYPMYILGSVIRGFSYALGSMVPMSILTERWFQDKRTLAISIISATSGAAALGVPSAVTYVIQHYGMRFSFFLSAGVFAVLYLIAWLIIRDDPSSMSLAPYKDSESFSKEAPSSSADDSSSQYLPDKWWPLISAAVFLGTSGVMCYSNLSLLSSTEGFAPETVAIVISVAGAGMTAGKLLFGTAATAFGLKKASFLFGSMSVIALIFCCLIRYSGIFLFAGAGFLGLSLSALIVGSVAWPQDLACQKDRADHVKTLQSMYNLGCLVFGVVIGIAADISRGSYIPFYMASAAIAVFFVIIIQAAYSRRSAERKKNSGR